MNQVQTLLNSYPKEHLAAALKIGIARSCLLGFVLHMRQNYMAGWVHREICKELDNFLADVVAKKSPRLMITVPPRHGKSELASRHFPAYVFGRYPDMQIISTSFAADLACRMNRDVQRIIDSNQYRLIFPDTTLSGKNIRTVAQGTYMRNSDIFEIVGHGGSYRNAGVGGGITGMGGNILIIDDPVKDQAEADSLTIRNKVWDWYKSTLYTRREAGGGVLLIQTRWHMDDLAGRILEEARTGDGDQWRVVNFPAIAERDEEHRKIGEALDPARWPLEELFKSKSTLGSRAWSALYQQHPVPDGGAIFRSEWFRYWTPADLPSKFDTISLSWDMAFKDNIDNDFVVGQVWGRSGADEYLLDQVHSRLSFTATVGAFIRQVEKWPNAREKLVEDKANGPAVIDALKSSIQGIIPINPEGSKTARAYAVTPLYEAGNVYIPHPTIYPWVDDYKTEMLQFPAGVNDDQVDATTQYLRRSMSQRMNRITIHPNFFGKKPS